MRGQDHHIRRSLAFIAVLAIVLVGGVSAAAAETVSGGYTGGESVQGAADDNPAPPPAVPEPPEPTAGRLAFTGSDMVRSLAVAGGGLLLGGALFVIVGRARREPSGAT